MEPQPIVIKSKRLNVDIAYPGTIYHGTRFDWTGFITQVTLDNQHTFCVPESYIPGKGTGGVGICNEFGIDAPVAYSSTSPGEVFPKLGIGLLKRPDEAEYDFFRTYEITQPFPIEVTVEDEQVSFIVLPIECRGYAVQLNKTLKVSDNQLTIHYVLQNKGEQTIETNEYVHNFIGIDKQPIGPDYRLSFPYRITYENLAPSFRNMAPAFMRTLLPVPLLDMFLGSQIKKRRKVLAEEGNEIGFRFTPTTDFYTRLIGFTRTDKPQWEITHISSGAGMREIDDFTPCRVAIWGVGHVVSAEIFVLIHLRPGEQMEWTRQFEFFSLPASI